MKRWVNSFWGRLCLCLAASYAPGLFLVMRPFGVWAFFISPIALPLFMLSIEDTKTTLIWLFIYFILLVYLSLAFRRSEVWPVIVPGFILVWVIGQTMLLLGLAASLGGV